MTQITPQLIEKMKDGKRRAATRSLKNNPILCQNKLYLCIRLTKAQAIKAFCTECMGFETNPIECTSWACALYPFRGRTLRTKEGNLTKDEAKLNASTPREQV